MSELKSSIRKFVVENYLFGQDENLTDESSFLGQGIIDSTGVLELIAHLEENYSIKVNDMELLPENLDSLNAVTSFVERKRAAAGVINK